jgi:integrase
MAEWGSIQWQKSAKRFYIQVYWQGKTTKIWSFLSQNTWVPFFEKRTAEIILHAMRADRAKGEFHPRSYKPDNPLSIRQYYHYWLDNIDVTKKTRADYRTAIVKHIIPCLGEDKDIGRIRKADITDLSKFLDNLSPDGRYNVLGTFKSMLRWAYSNEDIHRIPPFPKMSKRGKDDVEYLTLEQQESILREIPVTDQPIFRFAMEYGFRIGEVREIKRDSIRHGKVYIERTFSDNELRETTKTGRIRSADLTSYAREIINSLPQHFSPFLFVRSDGKPYTNKNLNKIWHEAEEKAGIKLKLYNSVRHSVGCQLLDEGHDIGFVQELLGHTTSEMTRRYARRTSKKIGQVLTMRRVSGSVVVEPEGKTTNNIK